MNKSDKNKLHKKQLGLDCPEDYFSTMRASLDLKIKQQALAEKHEAQLGMNVDSDYFEKSKTRILTQLDRKAAPIKAKRNFNSSWLIGIAASIAILISIGIGVNQFRGNNLMQNKLAQALVNEADAEEMLLGSIFVEDQKFEAIIDDYLLENMVLKSAVPVIEDNDPTLESLFLEEVEVEGFLNELSTDDFETNIDQLFE